jgi:hypothetical protein
MPDPENAVSPSLVRFGLCLLMPLLISGWTNPHVWAGLRLDASPATISHAKAVFPLALKWRRQVLQTITLPPRQPIHPPAEPVPASQADQRADALGLERPAAPGPEPAVLMSFQI